MANGVVLTDAGMNLLSLAMEGYELHFTRGAVGDGQIASDEDARTFTALKHEVLSLAIESIRTSKTGICECVFTVSNKEQETGFWLREYGLFATNPQTNEEVLYAYTNKGNQAGYLEGYDGANPINFALTMVTVIDRANHITANISTENSYVTVTRLESRIEDLFADSQDIAGVWTFGAESGKRLTAKSWQDFKLALMGVTDIASMNARLERLEDNFADTLLQLEMQNLYPDYSHYIIEDFRKPDQVDRFECAVTSIVAGDDSIDCAPIDGLLPGSWYTITDGINAELVQINSINIENGIQRIILKDTIKNTYDLETCRMYRTSAAITTDGARGSGVREMITWKSGYTWKGTEAHESQQDVIAFTEQNTDTYTLSGACELTIGGITLKG